MKVEDFVDPYLGQTWQSLGARVLSSGKRISVTLGYPAQGMQAKLTEQLSAFLGVDDIELDISFSSPPGRGFGQVKNVVLVSSGKGGVGKSTTAVNLALALDAEGAKVGLLDADIYGPSQGMMLGVAEGRRPDIKDGKFFDPIRAHGIKAMSMSFMITDKTPMVWRGPMASGALQQILGQTLWGDLDYLIVDMPPGTGDIQLTLSQKAPVAGAVIVTTPQDIALLDALKGIEMFAKVDIPVLGILENMSVHQCDNCGHLSHLFGEDGGKRVAEDLGVPLLGQLPLAMSIRQQADGGHPTVKAEPDSAISALYRDAARNMAARLWGKQGSTPTISMVDD
ncbi:MAG: iron-sulfur cluster carrier protein ApbC [Gammaproteobacteria bacterium]|jgi:ATP-binding protein involved in chromosome partitioning|nr:iron-sulfur cluster carrier protein ApbC [Gammaproteobacteria bacterium]MDA8703597.1 iron-sulfur cluster carrier protein ApbC [Pseudomonadales bacterium]MBT3695247.1 iron-sulfur cluster carrier protein ApbC [Gammaproteobacteria bacterium]MBT5333685.1 iron-sulfur cluster carrier protein ApbC [Gammaproteobacteria bacterium]MBT5682142.1 iron-sulfur cluster carrier protein ApbC [Gammaproteobacteria bacterium]